MPDSLSPDTHPRHRHYRPSHSSPSFSTSPPLSPPDLPPSLASPTLECFPSAGPSHQSPPQLLLHAKPPQDLQDPVEDPAPVSTCSLLPGTVSGGHPSSSSAATAFMAPRSPIDRSLAGLVHPSTRRLYSSVLMDLPISAAQSELDPHRPAAPRPSSPSVSVLKDIKTLKSGRRLVLSS
ncbi:Os11g0227350 [Oryza sativa Japonica Group]|uniref:Os11g0227350 protein n=1 Tax=Oryza sativa subsp. japonica TaxID=39947 RepID=A0A0P0Y082_ORYSJ|nr:Os11g0227350 [Oryza sativa Japonica Group]